MTDKIIPEAVIVAASYLSIIGPSVVPAASSPAKRWNVATSAYIDLDSRRWDGTKYVPVDISGGL